MRRPRGLATRANRYEVTESTVSYSGGRIGGASVRRFGLARLGFTPKVRILGDHRSDLFAFVGSQVSKDCRLGGRVVNANPTPHKGTPVFRKDTEKIGLR
jgi:hypothetical protein